MNIESGTMERNAVGQMHADKELSPVYALLRRVSMIDYPGRLCRVLFLAGCNMRCIYCHNRELVEASGSSLSWERLEEILCKSRENWVDAVTITGGEPTLNPSIGELILRVRDMGFKVKLDTNGSGPEKLRKLLPLVDYVAMDYKAPLERYRMMTACPSLELERISESVRLIREWEGQYEFRTTVVDSLLGEEDMLQICREIGGARRYVLQAYVPPANEETASFLPRVRTPIKLLKRYHELCKPYFTETILRGA